MAGVNKVIIIGHLGKDPEVKIFEGGTKNVKFTVATTETYKNKAGEKVEETEWHTVIFWGAVVETIEKYLKKGSNVYVEGKIKTRSYEDKDGSKKYITEIIGDKFTMLGSKKSSEGASAEPASNSSKKETPAAQPSFAMDTEDDLPF